MQTVSPLASRAAPLRLLLTAAILPSFGPSLGLAFGLACVGCGGGGEATAQPATAAAATAAPPSKPAVPSGPALPDKPESDKVSWKRDPSFAKCHNDVKTGADLVLGVTAMAKGCATMMKMHQVGQTVQGSRGNLDPAQVLPLHAEASHCYRVYGLSEDALKDLDIAMVDSAGKVGLTGTCQLFGAARGVILGQ